jgi:hypothetical protein
MNWLKKIFLTGIFVVLSIVFNKANAQSEQYINSSNYYTWIQTCNPDCGKGSFYTYVNRYYNQNSGYYYFEIYIWSNSYYKNCNEAYTYIDDVVIYVESKGNYTSVLKLDYYLASPKTATFNGWNYMAYVYSTNPNQKFKIKWSSISAY